MSKNVHEGEGIPHDTEKRCHPRQKVNIRALFNGVGQGAGSLHPGIVTDVSLNGLMIAAPKGPEGKLACLDMDEVLEIVLFLAEKRDTIKMTGKPRWVDAHGEALHMGITFSTEDFRTYQKLINYLNDM